MKLKSTSEMKAKLERTKDQMNTQLIPEIKDENKK